jgi:ABC-type glutathione transport system ATPase component
MNTIYQNYTVGSALIIMTISLFLFLFLGLYLDNVLPSTYGIRRPVCYCCIPSFWCRDRGRRRSQVDKSEKIDEYFEAQGMNPLNFEPVQKELLKQETDKKILKVTDLKKTFDNGFQAVKGINVKMYTGQIFALLGHNGAGKTTTISMLTGLIGSSSGEAEVLGLNLFDDMDEVRHKMGVCPQHDVLFNLLTPEEHLDIFCDFKGVDTKNKKEEI